MPGERGVRGTELGWQPEFTALEALWATLQR